MSSWLEAYEQGLRAQVWAEMTSAGPGLRSDDERFADAEAVGRETMKRARANVERLVELLPAIGYEFGDDPFPGAPPTPDELDGLEARIGLLPLSLRAWFEEVGQVNLVGTHPAWDFKYPDPLVVQAPVGFVLSDYEDWETDRGTEWDEGPVFNVSIAPDRLHKADVSGGPSYSLAVPNGAADGLLLWEPQQTTFVNYLRLTFAAGGFPGWQRKAGEVDDWALPSGPPPPELADIARRLDPI